MASGITKKYTCIRLDHSSTKSFQTFGGFMPNNPFQGILNFWFLSGFAGELDSDRLNEIRNEKVKVIFFFQRKGTLQYSKEVCGDSFLPLMKH